jgi:outer membrane protein assembly factor BamB
MTIRDNPSKPRPLLLLLTIVFAAAGRGAANDWTDWRGPSRDGISAEKGLPSSWSPAGENLAWKAPYGGRSTPIVLGDRLYLQNSVGRGETLQERVVCLNADTGALLWEHRFNVFLSDVPPHRIGWASPVADPATGNVYVFGVGGTLLGLSRDGKVIWERSLEEEFGLITTHGGRTVSPVIEADTVIVSGLTSGWGNQSRSAHRFMAFDKASGYTVWVSSPGGRPYDTTYSPPLGVVIGGMRLLIAGASDGAMHALKALTGEPVWKFEMSKRGINTGAVVSGSTVYVSHSEENLESSEMGLLAAIDGNSRGDIGKAQIRWSHPGIQVGYSSPVLDGERLYQIDNGSNLLAFDRESGRQLWTLNLGTIQKASPVLADGKLYVGTENGKFLILKPEPDRCEVLDEDQLGTEAAPEAIVASAAVSGGRIYLVTSDALYCIGKKSGAGSTGSAGALSRRTRRSAAGRSHRARPLAGRERPFPSPAFRRERPSCRRGPGLLVPGTAPGHHQGNRRVHRRFGSGSSRPGEGHGGLAPRCRPSARGPTPPLVREFRGAGAGLRPPSLDQRHR